MQRKSLIFIIVLLLANRMIWSQSILQTYYNGDTSKMKVEAEQLINLPEPSFTPESTMEDASANPKPLYAKLAEGVTEFYVSAEDGVLLHMSKLPANSKDAVLLLHGVNSTAGEYLQTARMLQKVMGAVVYVADFRGHGKSAGTRGDVAYIDQYADDLLVLRRYLAEKHPWGKLVLVAHSMGCGVTLRYLMQKQRLEFDGYILMAPLIGHNSPAIRQNPISEPLNSATRQEVKLHIQRIIGLKMVNEFGDHSRDSLPVLFFRSVAEGTGTYSYRANMSMAPDDYKTGLQALNKPAMVLIAEADEVFDPESLRKAVAENSKAVIKIMKGATHNSIKTDKIDFSYLGKWFKSL